MSEPDDPVEPVDPGARDGERDHHDEATQRDVAALLSAAPRPVMPADVADRLQAALRAESDLRRDPAAPAAATPTSIDRGRRRRLVPVLAAAAVTVGVLAVGSTVLTGPGSDEQGAAGSSADLEAAPSASDGAGTLARPPEARSEPAPQAADVLAAGSGPTPLEAAPTAPRCADGRLAVPSTVAVTYAGRSGWLVGYPGADGATTWAVYTCDGDTARALGTLTPPPG